MSGTNGEDHPIEDLNFDRIDWSGEHFPMSKRATRHCTEEEIKEALQKCTVVVEWPALGHTFVLYEPAGIILRLDGIMGGNVFPSVFYAWKYDNPFSFIRDKQEILYIPDTEAWIRERH